MQGGQGSAMGTYRNAPPPTRMPQMSVETPNPLSQYNGPVPFGSPMPTNMQTGGPYTRQAPPPTQLPRFMDTGGMLPPRMSDPFSQSAPPPTMNGPRDAQGNVYAGRESTPRAYTGGAFNPAANQWGDYSQKVGDGLFGTDANGINRFNGHEFAAESLNQGGIGFGNMLARFAPQFAAQNGPINMGQARMFTPPGLAAQGQTGMPGARSAFGGGTPASGGGVFGGTPASSVFGNGTPSSGGGVFGGGSPPSSGIGRSDPGGTPVPLPVALDPRTGQPYAPPPNPYAGNTNWGDFFGSRAGTPPPDFNVNAIDPRTGRPYGFKTL